MDIIDTTELFSVINDRLITLLRSLTNDDFNKKTQFTDWVVKDICAHLLDTSLRRLSLERDNYIPKDKTTINSYAQLIEHITNLADRWALAFSSISPYILIELIERYQNELYEYIKGLDPLKESHFPVSWAGEEKSLNWFDIAREYTERWHHQMQIREALGKEPLYERELYFPVLETFMRALPFHYREFKRENGYVLNVNIIGSSGGSWFIEWNDGIHLINDGTNEIKTQINIEQEVAWKIFTRWSDKSIYKVNICGDEELGNHIKDMNCLLIRT